MNRIDVIYDVFLLIACCWIIKTFILKINLSDREKFLMGHTNSLFRNIFVVWILLEIMYNLLSDIGIFSGVFDLYANGLLLLGCLVSMAGIHFISHRVDPKDWKYGYETKIGLIGIVFITLIYVLMYVFWNS